MYQSGFHAMHSTGSAPLKVTNYLLLTSDSKGGSVLVILDLTAASNRVDHGVLLEQAERCVGVKCVGVKWSVVLG